MWLCKRDLSKECEGKYRDCTDCVLDKVKAEIEQLRLHKAQFITGDNKVCIDSQEVLNVIDKYRTESEETDAD